MISTRRIGGYSAIAAATFLAACGGGSSDPGAAPSGSTAASALSINAAPEAVDGTVNFGATATQVSIRITDADQSSVVESARADAEGRFSVGTSGFKPPFRIEACALVGTLRQCLYSIANVNGSVNVTPLTTAATALAIGRDPEMLMNPETATPTSARLAQGEQVLRNALSKPMAAANIAAGDFFTTPFTTAGMGRILEAVSVSTGINTTASGELVSFAQITPKSGTGSFYVDSNGTRRGSLDLIGADADLSGIGSAFASLTQALKTAASCAADLPALLDADIVLRPDPASTPVIGRDAAALSLCGTTPVPLENIAAPAAGTTAGATTGPAPGTTAGTSPASTSGSGLVATAAGSTYVPIRIESCDFGSASKTCRVSYLMKRNGNAPATDGRFDLVNSGAGWLFKGTPALDVQASGAIQRRVRLDTDTPVVETSRQLSINIPTNTGALRCAKVERADGNLGWVHLAWYRGHATGSRRMSAVTQPLSTRLSSDVNGQTVPENESFGLGSTQVPAEMLAGDGLIEGFYAAGRRLRITAFSNSDCTGQSLRTEVDLMAVPPKSAAFDRMPWPVPSAASVAALDALNGNAGSVALDWAWPNGSVPIDSVGLCAGQISGILCGAGNIEPGRTTNVGAATSVVLQTSATAPIAVGAARRLIIGAHSRDALSMTLEASVCRTQADQLACR